MHWLGMRARRGAPDPPALGGVVAAPVGADRGEGWGGGGSAKKGPDPGGGGGVGGGAPGWGVAAGAGGAVSASPRPAQKSRAQRRWTDREGKPQPQTSSSNNFQSRAISCDRSRATACRRWPGRSSRSVSRRATKRFWTLSLPEDSDSLWKAAPRLVPRASEGWVAKRVATRMAWFSAFTGTPSNSQPTRNRASAGSRPMQRRSSARVARSGFRALSVPPSASSGE